MLKQKCLGLAMFLVTLLFISSTAFAVGELIPFKDKEPQTVRKIALALIDEYERNDQIDQAIALYEEALTIVEDEELMGRLANIYNSLSNYTKATEVYEKLVASRPSNMRYVNLLSLSYKRAGTPQKGLKLWEERMKDSTDAGVFMDAAVFFAGVEGYEKKAVEAGKKAVQLAPDNAAYKKNLDSFYTKANIEIEKEEVASIVEVEVSEEVKQPEKEVSEQVKQLKK